MKPEHAMPPAADKDFLDLRELSRTLWLAKWAILGVALLVMALSIAAARAQPPTYRATLTLHIEPRVDRAVPVKDVYDPGVESEGYYGTQYEILRSRELAGRVIDRLDLVDDPEFASPDPGLVRRLIRRIDWRAWLPFLPDAPPPAEPDPETVRQRVIDTFLTLVTVEPVQRTQLVRVHVESLQPEKAMIVANAIGDAFIESGLEARLDVTQRASRWLTDKLGEIRGKLENSELGLQKFREQQQLLNVGGVRKLVEEELLENIRRLRESQKTRTELASTYQKIQAAGDDPARLSDISTILLNPLVQRSKEAVLQAQAAMGQAQERYGEKHPQLIAARARLEEAEKSHREQLKLAVQGVRAEYEIAQENERAYARTVETARARIRELDRKGYDQSVLEREVATNRELYDMFLQRFKETDTAATYDQLNARIIDPAARPRSRFRPQLGRIAAISLIGGLFLGVLIALARDLLREGIRSVEDVEAISNAPVVGALPLASPEKRQSMANLFRDQPRTPFGEGIRSVRAALQLGDVDHRFHNILVTSSVPGEGKSSVAACLALSFAGLERVLVIDADLRAPSIHKQFGLAAEQPGLMEHLSGNVKLEDCIHRDPSGIHVLPVSKLPLNPSEVLASAAFAKLVEGLRERYDRLIFDSPPLLAASDALVLAKLTDAVLMVVKVDGTDRRAMRNAIKSLRQLGVTLFGSVVNKVDTRRRDDFYSSHYYAYGYYGKTR